MPVPGEPRLASRIGRLSILVAVLIGVWWWRHRGSDAPATRAVTQPQPAAATSSSTMQRSAPARPAALAITVSDDQGPLAGATVRLAPADGEILAITTGGDGVARAERLEPGTWRISASAVGHLPSALPAHALAAGADDRLAIRLVAGGRTLHGTVSDATGGPIAGARIDAARLTALAEPGDTVSTVTTGADGTYKMTVAEGQLLVAASSPDYAPQSRRVEVGATGAVADFALVPGGVIEGVVRDERSREPIAGAAVVARRGPATLLAETAARRATSGPDGRFRIGGLRPGAWDLGATDHARSSRQPTVVGLGVAEQVSDVELLIGAGPVIRGRVVDGSGAAAPGVEVRALARGEGSEAKAGADGAFVLEGLPPATYFLTTRGDAYLPSGGVRVPLADKDVDGVVVTVRRGATLTGHVEPRQVCDVQPELDERGGMLMLVSGTSTAADGEFKLGPVADGPLRLTARCASGDQGAAQATVAPGMPELVLKVAPGGSIAGRVIDGDGKPVVGIGVIATEVSQGERTMIQNGAVTSGVQDLTDAAGAYKLVGLSAGSYKLGVLDRGRPLRLRRPPPTMELAASEHRTGVELAVDRPTGVISGTITGPDGKPLADAWVSAQQDLMAMFAGGPDGDGRAGPPKSRTMVVDNRSGGGGGGLGAADTAFPPALTDAQGHYAIRGLPAATYTVIAEAQRGQLRARAVDVRPDATVDLRVLPVAALTGTVTGPAGPAALFSVELDGPTRAQRSFTDGRFSFGRVDPGSYTVRVQSSDGSGEAKIDVTNDAPASVAITLAANAIVTGRLVDAAGKPLAGLPVALIPDTGDGRLQVQLEGPPPTTGADGSFRLEHRAGRCVLIAMRPPQPFTLRGIELGPGKTVDLGAINADAQPAPPAGPRAPRP